MARRNISVADLVSRYEGPIASAFLAAIDDIKDEAQVTRIIDALRANDVERAINYVGIDNAAFFDLRNRVREAYEAGGVATAGGFPAIPDGQGGRVVIRFDATNPRAEAWIAQHSSTLITEIVNDQREATRFVLNAGLEAGRNPRNVALDIVGRMDRRTGRREGGILGVTSQQARYVVNAREELLSGDPALLRRYLDRERRDRRFDRLVTSALNEGRAVSSADADRITARYSDRLLQLRGETIGRTEAMASLHSAQKEAFDQAVESGNVRREQVRRVWQTARDARVRDSHAAMHGESVGIDERFSNGLMYPAEPGGDAAEVINCRCTLAYRIDFLANIR